MKRFILTIALLSSALVAGAQTSIEEVLRSVETNNKELQANRQMVTAQKLEAKLDNNLPDPTVTYSHLYGNKEGMGFTGELVASQSFDFPSLYMQRNKLSKQKGENYDRQGEEVRQQILLQAKEACLDLIFLNQQKNLLDIRRKSAEQLAALYQQRLEQGDANILETNKIELELLNVRNEVLGEEIGMIFQEPMTSLNPVMRVGLQVRETLLLHRKISPQEAKAEVLRIFRKVGISEPERRYNCYPHELSGGLRQRVMIAMAMICRPKLVIADEPTTALDVTVEAQILQLMRALRDETSSGIVIISHNLGVIAQLCDYVYVMYAGRVVEQADTFDLFAHPMHPYTAGLMAAVSSLARGNGALEIIPGTVPNLLHLPVGCSFSPRCAKCGTHCGDVVPELREVSSGHLVRCINIPEVRL